MKTSILKQFRLDGQVALVVGGNRGLGFEMARRCPKVLGYRTIASVRQKIGRLPSRFGKQLDASLKASFGVR